MKRLLVLATLTLFALSSTAFGFSLMIPDYQGDVWIKYSNWEEEVVNPRDGETPGDILFGIGKVSSITTTSGTTLWQDGYNGEELTVEFGGYELVDQTGFGFGGEYFFEGGFFNIWLDDSQDFNSEPYPTGTGVTNGTPFLTLNAVGGVLSGIGDDDTTLHSIIFATSPFLTGKGFGLLEITGGNYASMFGGAGEILTLESDFSVKTVGTWAVTSQDPVSATVVPEPSTFLLLAGGLLGLGFLSKRKRQN